VFDNAVKLYGEWRSPASPGSPGGRSPSSAGPIWTIWRTDIRLLDKDDTPLRKQGAWQVRWTDRTESFVAGSDVRTCVPTRERLRAEAQAPAAKRARRVTESPRRVTESPQPRLPGPPALLPDEYARGAAAAPPVGGLRATPPVPRVPRYVGGVEQRTSSADTRALAEYLRVCGAQDLKQLAGAWSFTYIARPSGGTASGRKVGDRYFHPPNGGKKLRSMAEVARWHGLSPSTSNVGGISDEEKRERREARFMAQHDKEALLLQERRAMAQHDKRSTRGGHPPDRRDWHAVVAGGKKDVTPVADGLITRVRRLAGICARLAVGGVFLQSRFDSARHAENALKVAVSAQRCVCGRSEGGDYVKCAGGATGSCHGFVHRQCVGLSLDEEVPEGWLCPLCDTHGVASKLSVHGGPLATPLIGRVLLQARGDEDKDDAAAQAPLLLRAVGARKKRGGGVLVRCVALFGEGEEVFQISEATARRAAARRETAELQAQLAMMARGGKYTFHTTTADCEVCAHCLDKPKNGGPGTTKQACIAKDDERAIALLYLASGAPPPGGGQWITHGAAAAAPVAPAPRARDQDDDWEATARRLLKEIRGERDRNRYANLEVLRPALTRCGFSGTPPPWRAGNCSVSALAHFPEDPRIRSLVQLVRYFERALGEASDKDDEDNPRPTAPKAGARGYAIGWDDGEADSDDDEGFVRKGARCVAPWIDGQWYAATVQFAGKRTARVAFEDGTIHTVERSELLEDDRSSRRNEGEAVPAKPRPPPPPPPPSPRPTGPCAICMSTIEDGAHVLECGHAFHTNCLRDLADHVRLSSATRRSLAVSCPLCRKVTRAEVGADADEEA